MKALSRRAHLTLDATKCALLASSPWPLGYGRRGTRYWTSHVLVGASDVLATAIGRTR